MFNFDLNETPVVEEMVAKATVVRPSNAPNGTAKGVSGLAGPWWSSPEFATADSNMAQERRPQVINGAPNWASELASVPAQCHRVVRQVIRPTPRRWDQLGARDVENMSSIFRPLAAPVLGRPPAVPAPAIDVASTSTDPRQQGSQGAGLQQDMASLTTTKSVDEFMEHNGVFQASETNGGSRGIETNGWRTLKLSAGEIDYPNNVSEGKRPTVSSRSCNWSSLINPYTLLAVLHCILTISLPTARPNNLLSNLSPYPLLSGATWLVFVLINLILTLELFTQAMYYIQCRLESLRL